MRKLLTLTAFLYSSTTLSALPPQYRMEEDLMTMVKFITNNETVAATLKSIDMTTFKVHYGNGCWVQFGRKKMTRPIGWAGPAPDLEVKSSNCPL